MNGRRGNRFSRISQRPGLQRIPRRRVKPILRPAAAHHQRATREFNTESFNAPEKWHEPAAEKKRFRFIEEPAGDEYFHPLTEADIRARLEMAPPKFTHGLDVVQLSGMTKKRSFFPCYGMQWGSTIYLYPFEESLVETYSNPPLPHQLVEAKMYGGRWREEDGYWLLEWTEETIRDFYLHNVLIHELGHINDDRNTSHVDRERYANWFAVEYGYRVMKAQRAQSKRRRGRRRHG